MKPTRYCIKALLIDLRDISRDFEAVFERRGETFDPASEVHRNLDTAIANLEMMDGMTDEALEDRCRDH